MGEASAQKRLSLYGEGVQNLALSCVRALWKAPHGNIYHFFPIFSVNTYWNYQKTLIFSEDFGGYWKGTKRRNRLSSNNEWTKANECPKLKQPKISIVFY